MSVFSRRLTDSRKVWDDNSSQSDEDLNIPPFEALDDIEKAKFENIEIIQVVHQEPFLNRKFA